MPISKDEEIIRRGLNANPKIINPSDNLLETLKQYYELPIAKHVSTIHQMNVIDAI